MKHDYSIAQRVHASTYANVAEQFKIYLNSLPSDEIDEIESDFRANGNGLLSLRQTEIVTELFDSFAISTAGFPIHTDIFLFLMVKLFSNYWRKSKPQRALRKVF